MCIRDRAREAYGPLPVVYAGGVMCNSLLRAELQKKYGGCYFADPLFSADNAAGVALLGRDRHLQQNTHEVK